MSYGIRIWGANGALELDENSFTVGIVYSALIPRTLGVRYVDIVVPGIEPTKYSAVCIPISAYDTSAQNISAIGFTPIVGAGYVRVFFGAPSVNTGPMGTSTQRLMVMRYK